MRQVPEGFSKYQRDSLTVYNHCSTGQNKSGGHFGDPHGNVTTTFVLVFVHLSRVA